MGIFGGSVGVFELNARSPRTKLVSRSVAHGIPWLEHKISNHVSPTTNTQ